MKNIKSIFTRGYTLVELLISVGLFAIIMTLASGGYLVMIHMNQQTQNLATGVNNLSFALERMAHTIRTGSSYNCGSTGTGTADCHGGANTFTFTDDNGNAVTYSLVSGAIQQSTIVSGTTYISQITDPVSVTITNLTFYAFGTTSYSSGGDTQQARVTITVSGYTQTAPGKPKQTFTIETGATMRGSDL